MTQAIERKVITNFIVDTNSSFTLSPFGLDGEPVKLSEGAGFLTILHGQASRRGIGPATAHLYEYPGVALITFFTAAEGGSAGAVATVDSILTAFTGLKLDEDGGSPDASSTDVIDFDRAGAPHVQSQTQETPYLRTVVSAPFVHSERI